MTFLPITFTIPRKFILKFQKQARDAFPKETITYYVGHNAGTSIEVIDMWTPDPQELAVEASRMEIAIPNMWLAEAAEFALEREATVVADCHSHAYRYKDLGTWRPDCGPSQDDLICQHVFGICSVYQGATGKLRSYTRFFGPVVPVNTQVIDSRGRVTHGDPFGLETGGGH